MHRIGIIGHSPEHFGADQESVQRAVGDTIDLLAYQYSKTDMVFNIIADIGVGLWAAHKCLAEGHRYHLFLSHPLEETGLGWYAEQRRILELCYQGATSITISGEEDMTHKLFAADSNFMVCFWIGKKQGTTFETIKYALKNNVLTLHGLDHLKLITNSDIRGKRYVKRKKSATR